MPAFRVSNPLQTRSKHLKIIENYNIKAGNFKIIVIQKDNWRCKKYTRNIEAKKLHKNKHTNEIKHNSQFCPQQSQSDTPQEFKFERL